MRLTPRHLLRSERGAAMIEFAVVLPVLILLFMGMVDFGRALFLYNNLTNAVREGARLGAVQGTTIDAAAIRTRVTNRVRTFSGNAAAAPSVTVASTLQDVTVTITNYTFNPITPLPMVNGLQLSVSAVFRRESAP